MKRVFADTSYWIAHLNPADSLHSAARRAARAHAASIIVTGEMVSTEVLNAFSDAGAQRRAAAVRLVHSLRGTPGYEVVSQNEDWFQKAFALYAARTDKAWGLTDCRSFAIMRDMAISEALAADTDFQQAGFRALLREL
jgi:hypothetical protein